MRLELGKRARLEDGDVREIADVVIDAGTNRVTHVVVQPKDDPDDARLVALDLVAEVPGGRELSLQCTAEAFAKLERVREHDYLRLGEHRKKEPGWDVGVEDVQPLPTYQPAAFGDYGGDISSDVMVTFDRVPKGEIELRHASAVYSSDSHHVGQVAGLEVDRDDHISSLVLERGHLWWRREIVIPAEAVGKLASDSVTLAVPKAELGNFRSQRRD
jgi:sporulation protein YlmC with PRC-barrel domain